MGEKKILSGESLVRFVEKGEKIFLGPGELYPSSEIISGKKSAVGPNTFRGFHRINKSKRGASAVFRRYLTDRKNEIVRGLLKVKSSQELDTLENKICDGVRAELTNVRPEMLRPYNKVRKIIDLYIEHLVSMAEELSPNRASLVPFLNLPLDSQMFSNEEVFLEEELSAHGLSRRSTYSSVKDEEVYKCLQRRLEEKAGNLSSQLSGRRFRRIYFDLLWGGRYKNPGSNLMETNP